MTKYGHFLIISIIDTEIHIRSGGVGGGVGVFISNQKLSGFTVYHIIFDTVYILSYDHGVFK